MEESIALYSYIKRAFGEGGVDVRTYSPLALAFLGDCVFELVVRTCLVGQGNRAPEELHRKKSAIVNAAAQARMAEGLYESLTEEEREVYRRGRNAKSASTAKNASVSDYRRATGLEALCGYLFLQDRTERVVELIREGIGLLGRET